MKIDIYEVNEEVLRGKSGILYCNYMPSPNQQFDIKIKLLLAILEHLIWQHLCKLERLHIIAW